MGGWEYRAAGDVKVAETGGCHEPKEGNKGGAAGVNGSGSSGDES